MIDSAPPPLIKNPCPGLVARFVKLFPLKLFRAIPKLKIPLGLPTAPLLIVVRVGSCEPVFIVKVPELLMVCALTVPPLTVNTAVLKLLIVLPVTVNVQRSAPTFMMSLFEMLGVEMYWCQTYLLNCAGPL